MKILWYLFLICLIFRLWYDAWYFYWSKDNIEQNNILCENVYWYVMNDGNYTFFLCSKQLEQNPK